MKPVLSSEDARLLFALLDAAEDDGLVSDASFATQWREARARITVGGRYQPEGIVFWTMLNELERAGTLEGSWIRDRWRSVKAHGEPRRAPQRQPRNDDARKNELAWRDGMKCVFPS